MNLSEIKQGIIAPALREVGLYSDTALNLITGTGLVESGYIYTHQIGGPALGWFQMEPVTYRDCWDNYLKYKPELAHAVASLCPSGLPSVNLLQSNPAYAAAMCRVKYLRSPIPLPKNTAFNLCQYWKQIYNSGIGKGKVDAAHVSLFQKAIDA